MRLVKGEIMRSNCVDWREKYGCHNNQILYYHLKNTISITSSFFTPSFPTGRKKTTNYFNAKLVLSVTFNQTNVFLPKENNERIVPFAAKINRFVILKIT